MGCFARRVVILLSLATTATTMFPSFAKAEVVLLGVASLPGDAVDKSGLTGILSDGSPHNRLGSIGSAIAYTGIGNRYILVPDRGPNDGKVDYYCRVHFFDIFVNAGKSTVVQPTLIETKLLKTESGKQLSGKSSYFDPAVAADSLRFDPEGVRVSGHRTFYLSDEYGPYLYEFNFEGRRVRTFSVPEKFCVARPDEDAKRELTANKKGRIPNKGMEALAISPDGKKLYGLMQSPLIQDGGRDGLNARLLEIVVKTNMTRELVYPLENKKYVLSEIVAVGNQRFLVIERDGRLGLDAQFKKLFLIDIAGATDVSKVASLPKKDLPENVVPVRKTLFLDLLDRRFGLAGPKKPGKIEGLAFGPDLPDGRRLLLVTADNDFQPQTPTWIYAFAVDREDLVGFQAQEISRQR